MAGCLFGAALTIAFAAVNGWRVDLPPWLFLAAIAAAILVGTLSGAYPALRASAVAARGGAAGG